jgi:hypothetical protein
MNLTVLVEKMSDKRFRATSTQPFVLESEGTSREQALERLRQLAVERFQSGEIVNLELPGIREDQPWRKFVGVWKDHPDLGEVRENIAEYRRQVDTQDDEHLADVHGKAS